MAQPIVEPHSLSAAEASRLPRPHWFIVECKFSNSQDNRHKSTVFQPLSSQFQQTKHIRHFLRHAEGGRCTEMHANGPQAAVWDVVSNDHGVAFFGEIAVVKGRQFPLNFRKIKGSRRCPRRVEGGCHTRTDGVRPQEAVEAVAGNDHGVAFFGEIAAVKGRYLD
jgi:hypothetical protein